MVLALLTERPRHGYDLEKEIGRRNIRLWAKIGASTVYKTLHDLKQAGHLTVEPGVPLRGAGRDVFAITSAGRAHLAELVAKAFRSDASIYSDRIVAMAFAGSVEPEGATRGLIGARKGSEIALKQLERAREMTDSMFTNIILDFYSDVMLAERRALDAVALALGLDLDVEP